MGDHFCDLNLCDIDFVHQCINDDFSGSAHCSFNRITNENGWSYWIVRRCSKCREFVGGKSGDKSADDGSGRGRKKRNSKKALSMMASKKITEITSGDRIWEIDVREKHRTSVIEEKVQKSFVDFQKSEAREEDVSIDHEGWKELKSLQAIVDNPITLYCLRMFMTSNLTINNLLFILEAEEWQNRTKGKFEAIYHKYCDDRSPAQINLNANMFEAISKVERGEEVLTGRSSKKLW